VFAVEHAIQRDACARHLAAKSRSLHVILLASSKRVNQAFFKLDFRERQLHRRRSLSSFFSCIRHPRFSSPFSLSRHRECPRSAAITFRRERYARYHLIHSSYSLSHINHTTRRVSLHWCTLTMKLLRPRLNSRGDCAYREISSRSAEMCSPIAGVAAKKTI